MRASLFKHTGAMSENLFTLTVTECLTQLSLMNVGRLCIVEDEYPVAFPVNYRMVPGPDGEPKVVMRTEPGGLLQRPGEHVSLQIDGFDPVTDTGWSVICRGVLHDATASDEWLLGNDPHPWIEGQHQWQYIETHRVSGRRVKHPEVTWALSVRGYL